MPLTRLTALLRIPLLLWMQATAQTAEAMLMVETLRTGIHQILSTAPTARSLVVVRSAVLWRAAMGSVWT